MTYSGDELDELDKQVERHVVLWYDTLLTSRKQQLKNVTNTTEVKVCVCVCVWKCAYVCVGRERERERERESINHINEQCTMYSRLSCDIALSLDTHHVDPTG